MLIRFRHAQFKLTSFRSFAWSCKNIIWFEKYDNFFKAPRIKRNGRLKTNFLQLNHTCHTCVDNPLFASLYCFSPLICAVFSSSVIFTPRSNSKPPSSPPPHIYPLFSSPWIWGCKVQSITCFNFRGNYVLSQVQHTSHTQNWKVAVLHLNAPK